MMDKKKIFLTSVMIAAASVAMHPAAYADEDMSPWSLDGYIGLTTDHRDRGLTLTDADPAIIASVGMYHEGGMYFGVSGGTMDDTTTGSDAKVNLFAGYSLDAGDYVYDFSLELDSVHGNGSQYFPEIGVSVARDFGLAFIRGGVNYAPDGRWSLPDQDSVFLFTDLEIPVPNMPELTIISRLGYDMRSDAKNLWNWGVGVSAFIGDIELTAMYENNSYNQPIGRGRVIFGAKYYF